MPGVCAGHFALALNGRFGRSGLIAVSLEHRGRDESLAALPARRRAAKACFSNAYTLTMEKGGTYCEGIPVGKSFGFHHAWITLDGEHAIDVTLSAITMAARSCASHQKNA
jgi:hypothetical protein